MKSPVRHGATITRLSVRGSILIIIEGNRMTERIRKINLLQRVRSKLVGEGALTLSGVFGAVRLGTVWQSVKRRSLSASDVESQGIWLMNVRVRL
jgi:hypothetical protein